jgi:hypothetical protein
MLNVIVLLTVVAGLDPAAGCLVAIDADYREISSQPWLEEVDVMYIDRDYLVAKVDGATLGRIAGDLPAHAVIDRGDVDGQVYLSARIASPVGRAGVGGLGTIVLERDNHVIIRQEGDVPADFRLDGLTGIVPLRERDLSRAGDAPAVTQPAEPDASHVFNQTIADIVGAVDEASYQGVIQILEDHVTRNARTVQYQDACGFSHDTMEFYGISTEIVEFWADPWWGSGFPCWNVVGEKPGLVDPDQIVIICGHLDSTAGDPSSPEGNAPGADDNGSGAAAVLEAARILSFFDFAYTLRFVCFGAEEQGLCGSTIYAQAAAAAGEDIVGVVNLDMVLYGPQPYDRMKINYDQQSQSLADAFGIAASTYVPDLDVLLNYNPGAMYSDHYPFWVNGYEAVQGCEEHLSSNPYYHQTSDVLSNYYGYFPFGTNCFRGAIATVAMLAQPTASTALAEVGSPGVGRLAIAGISPNPVNDLARVTLSTPTAGAVRLTLYDVVGRAVRWESVRSLPGGEVGMNVEVAGLPSASTCCMHRTRRAQQCARWW